MTAPGVGGRSLMLMGRGRRDKGDGGRGGASERRLDACAAMDKATATGAGRRPREAGLMVQSGGMHGLASLDPNGLSAAVGRPGLRGRRATARGLCGPRRRGGGRRGPGRAALSLFAGLVPRQHGLSVGLHSLRPTRDVSALVGDRPGLRTGGRAGSGGRRHGHRSGTNGRLDNNKDQEKKKNNTRTTPTTQKKTAPFV